MKKVLNYNYYSQELRTVNKIIRRYPKDHNTIPNKNQTSLYGDRSVEER